MIKKYYKDSAHTKKAIVISCYRWEWQQVLTIEGARELESCGYEVEYLELTGLESSLCKNWIKNLVVEKNGYRSRIRLLKSRGIAVHRPRLKILTAKLQMKLQLLTRFDLSTLAKSRWEVVYPGLVDLTNDVNVSFKSHKKLTRNILMQDLFFTRLLANWGEAHPIDFETVLIVNGRFPLNRAAADFFRKKNQSVTFIEFGSNRERFQFYNVSPHSMTNRRKLFQEFLENTSLDADISYKLGSDFFEGRRKFDAQANLSWTRKMDPEIIPEIDAQKKVCTFFPTSEKEFAGVGDIPPLGHFKDQHEALNALIQQLDDSWDIYIRRHPRATDARNDPELERWEAYNRFPNVQIISPDSNVDSYALGMRSALVAHYSSFIGPELIFAGHDNVVTLGPTQWEHLDPHRHLHNSQEISNYFKTGRTLTNNPRIHLLGFYMSTFGKDFKSHSWDALNGIWTLNQ